MIRGPIRRLLGGDCRNNNEKLKGEWPPVEFTLHDQEIYFNQVTAGRIFPQPPPQIRSAPPPNWLFTEDMAFYDSPCPFDESSLKYFQTYMGLQILADCNYVLVKQTCTRKSQRKKLRVYMKFTYEVLSPSGSLIFCKTEAMNCVQRFMSCGMSSYRRPYIAKLIDAWATRTITVKQNIERLARFPRIVNAENCFSPMFKHLYSENIEYLITYENGFVIGTVRRAKKFKRAPRFYITNATTDVPIIAVGKRDLIRLTMPTVTKTSKAWFRNHYSFTFHEIHCYKRQIRFQFLGSVTKFLDDLSETQANDSNRYIFKLQFEDHLDIVSKMILLGSCLVIDYEYWRSED